jgi:hypothetical protein
MFFEAFLAVVTFFCTAEWLEVTFEVMLAVTLALWVVLARAVALALGAWVF